MFDHPEEGILLWIRLWIMQVHVDEEIVVNKANCRGTGPFFNIKVLFTKQRVFIVIFLLGCFRVNLLFVIQRFKTAFFEKNSTIVPFGRSYHIDMTLILERVDQVVRNVLQKQDILCFQDGLYCVEFCLMLQERLFELSIKKVNVFLFQLTSLFFFLSLFILGQRAPQFLQPIDVAYLKIFLIRYIEDFCVVEVLDESFIKKIVIISAHLHLLFLELPTEVNKIFVLLEIIGPFLLKLSLTQKMTLNYPHVRTIDRTVSLFLHVLFNRLQTPVELLRNLNDILTLFIQHLQFLNDQLLKNVAKVLKFSSIIFGTTVKLEGRIGNPCIIQSSHLNISMIFSIFTLMTILPYIIYSILINSYRVQTLFE